MKWAEMNEHERDMLVAEKVMGYSSLCYEPITTHKAGILYLSYCPLHGLINTSDSQPDLNAHDKEEPIPHYTTSMDAAWLVVEKMVGRMGYPTYDPDKGFANSFEWNGPLFKAPNTHTSSYTHDRPNSHTGHLFYTKAGGNSGILGETCWYVRMLLNGRYWSVFADTPHETICLAALRAMGVEIEA